MEYKIEYYLYYESHFNISIEQLMDIIKTVSGVTEVYSQQHPYFPERTVIVFGVSNSFKDVIIYQKVVDLLSMLLYKKAFSVREKAW